MDKTQELPTYYLVINLKSQIIVQTI